MDSAWEKHADAALALLDELLVEVSRGLVPPPMSWLLDPCAEVDRALRQLGGDDRTARQEDLPGPMQLNNLNRRIGEE